MQPLTPLSAADFRSPLADRDAEIASLRKKLATARQLDSFKTDSRVLDLQLQCRNLKAFVKGCGLIAEFNECYPA
jgi:hypothetical protein